MPEQPAARPDRATQRPTGPDGLGGWSAAYPEPVQRLIAELAKLPGIGKRSAERLAFHVMKGETGAATALAQAILDTKQRVRHCRVCYSLTDDQTCAICEDARRDRGLVLVVEQPKDLLALEQTGLYKGVFHVLMGHISPLERIGPGDITAGALLERVRQPERNSGGVRVREVVMGLNPTLEGDGTALYLAEQLKGLGVGVSRLARGLPTGSHLEYANRAVLADAIQGRQRLG
jgi:recombination protein RecR